MKSKIFFLLLLNIFFYKNTPGIVGELIIHNKNNSTIVVKVIPFGAIFNGNKIYKLGCVNTRDGFYKYVYGGEDTLILNDIFTIDHDGDLQYPGEAEKSIGYGKYKLEFYINQELNGYCFIDFSDFDYPYGSPFTADLHIYYYSVNDIRAWDVFQSLPGDSVFKIWDQRVLNPNSFKNPNRNGFLTDSQNVFFPINAIDSGSASHINPGSLYLNTEIKFSSSISNIISNPTIVSLKD